MKKPKGYWTYEKCKEEALKYKYKKDLINNGKGAYNASLKNKWLDDICCHMKKYPPKLKNINEEYQVDHFQYFDIKNPIVPYIY